MAAPAYGTSGTLLTGTASTASFAVPASVASLDIIVVVFFLDGSNTVTAYPSGFAEAENSPVTLPAGGGQHSLHVVWKRATGADSGTYDFTFASSTYREGAAHRYTGAVTSGTPFDSPTGSASDTANATTTPPVSTTTLGADRLLLFAGTDWAGGSWTPPTGYAERMDSGVGLVTLDDLAQATAGSSGNISATSTGSNKRAAWIGGLIPAGAAATSGVQPLVVTAAGPVPRPTVILQQAPTLPAGAPQPLVVTAARPPAGPLAILTRGTLVDPPVLTTPSPTVVTAPVPVRPGQVLLLQNPQPAVAPVSGPTTAPVVITAPVGASAALAIAIRSPAATVAAATPVPYVITQPAPTPATPRPILARGSLVDFYAGTKPLVVGGPGALPAGFVAFVRSPQPASTPVVVQPRTPTVTVDVARTAVAADAGRAVATADLTRPSVRVSL